jgi:hypothetical protein
MTATENMMKTLLAAIVLVTLSGCSSKPSKPIKASLSEQKMCAEQAAKFFEEHGASGQSYTNHYASGVCYVEITYHDFQPPVNTRTSSIYDAFEGRDVAGFFEKSNENEGTRRVVMCKVGKTTCTSEEEYDRLLMQSFGMESAL